MQFFGEFVGEQDICSDARVYVEDMGGCAGVALVGFEFLAVGIFQVKIPGVEVLGDI